MNSSSSSLSDTQTPCSANAFNSQDLQEPRIAWGKLYSTTTFLKPVDLNNACFVLGRAETCDVILSKDNFPNNLLRIVSKNHFTITRIVGQAIINLTDLSKNGTYVNKQLVGRGNSIILQNDDEISIGTCRNRVYIYKTMESEETLYLPQDLRNKYIISKLLGNGAFGEVRLMFEKATCQEYAVKRIFKKLDNEKGINPIRVETEINILKRLSHPFIVSAQEIVETDVAVFIVLEYMQGGELTDYIRYSSKPLSESTVKFIFLQIVLGVQYLHREGITHRDLKPENVLLKSNDIEASLVKISDFGLSKIVSKSMIMATFCGTTYYIAPEIIDVDCTTYSQQVDIWSLGVILFYMLSQDLPFKTDDDQISLFRIILRARYVMDEKKWENISCNAKDLIKKMLNKNPNSRIKIDEVINHPWIVQDQNVQQRVTQLLDEDFIPNKRLCLDTTRIN